VPFLTQFLLLKSIKFKGSLNQEEIKKLRTAQQKQEKKGITFQVNLLNPKTKKDYESASSGKLKGLFGFKK
jgi:hypothetical protein